MKTAFRALTLLCFALASSSLLHAQAIPAASRPFALSAFGGATGTFTGLAGGKNVGITAGFDITFKPYHSYYFSGEIRGTYPFDDGKVDSQRNFLYGVKVERYFNNLHPYVDFLYGRDKIDYESPGYPNPAGTLLYIDSVSNIFSVGGGLDYTLTGHFAIKIDGQFQRLGTPVTSSGSIYSGPITVGVVYRFGSPPLAP